MIDLMLSGNSTKIFLTYDTKRLTAQQPRFKLFDYVALMKHNLVYRALDQQLMCQN
jgi:hypothetical protein